MMSQAREPLARSSRFVRAFVLAAVFAAVGFVGYLSRPLYRDVYSGVPATIPVEPIDATCQADAGSQRCTAVVRALNPGRFRVATSIPASVVSVRTDDASAIARTRFLVVRTQVPGRLVVHAAGAESVDLLDSDIREGARHVIEVPAGASGWHLITFTPTASRGPVVIDELGFLEDRSGLLRPSDQPLPWIAANRFYAVYAVAAALVVCAFVVIAAWFAPSTALIRSSPLLIGVLCFSICILELGMTFSPYWSRDLRSVYAEELARSGSTGNLTGGLFEGSRIVQGLGQTVSPGFVQWHRMPGYGLFCALAAAVGRTTDVINIAMVVIVFQVILYSGAVGLFWWAAQRVFEPWMAWLLGVLLVLLPKQVANTQVDAPIAAIAIVVLAALLVHLSERSDDGRPTAGAFVLVNVAFALWFVMRNDVLPGWIVVSLVLAHRRWRYLAVPALLIVTIALPWALYKQHYRHELDLMPTNTGEVLFLSLCEVPGAFPYDCSDAGYLEWAARISPSDPTSSATSHRAVAEVVRHWVTYPVHFVLMVEAKFRRCVFVTGWPGFRTLLNQPYGTIQEGGGFLVLLAVVVVSVVVNHQRLRSVLLGWALFFNMPLFFVAYESSGRFYAGAGVSLVVAAVPLMFESDLYRQMARHPRRVAAVLVCVAAFLVGAHPAEDWVLKNDSLHYWAPLLDPSRSTLRFSSH
jgi:hypothetical protein